MRARVFACARLDYSFHSCHTLICHHVTDTVVSPLLGNPNDLIGATPYLNDWKSIDKLRLLNLGYDVTPTAFIMMVITEYGMIPPTSVPVVLREYQQQPPSYLE